MTRVLVGMIVLAVAAPAGAQDRDATIEWPYVGGDQAHTKFSPADRITAANVDRLEIVWEWEPNELPLSEYGTRPGSFEATPLMIDGVLYLSTMYTRVVALDAETGAELWAFDPRAYETGAAGASPGGYKHRGVAVHGEGDDMRVFINSRVSLYALDARTGDLVTSFGDGGEVALTEGFPNEVSDDEFDQTSPPSSSRIWSSSAAACPTASSTASIRPGPCRPSTCTRASGGGCSTRCRNRTTNSAPTPGRTSRGASRATPTCGA